MALANEEAQRLNHEYIGTEHILLGLIKEGGGVGAHVLNILHVNLDLARKKVAELVKSGPDIATLGKLPQTPRAKQVIVNAIEESRLLNHNHVGTDHLLLGLMRETDGVAAQVLLNLGLTSAEIRNEIMSLLNADMEPNTRAAVDNFLQSDDEIKDTTGPDSYDKAQGAKLDDGIKSSEGFNTSDRKSIETTKWIVVAIFIVAFATLIICGINCYLLLKK
jgi:ATP-dependent Clp protease ATP-binding subunit ClpC